MLQTHTNHRVQIIFLLIFLAFHVGLMAQELHLKGKVLLAENTPAPQANILVKKAGQIIAYYSTDNHGRFDVRFSLENDTELSFTYISYKPATYNKERLRSLNQNDAFSVVLQPDDIFLETITIKKQKDTLSLNLENMKLQEKSTLKDILKQSPNFKVSDDVITYKGQNIDKIEINKKRAFVNQNKEALEALEKNMIEEIQIVNKKSDAFSLSFGQMPENVLNINTKSHIKGLLMPSVRAGLGYKHKYDNQARIMYFGDANFFAQSGGNNIEKIPVNPKALQRIAIGEKQPTTTEAQLIQMRLAPNENVTLGNVFGNQLVFRKENQKSRLESVVYFFDRYRKRQTTENAFDYAQNALYKQSQNQLEKTQLFIGQFRYDYKPNTNSILAYRTSGRWIDDKYENQQNINSKTIDKQTFLYQKNPVISLNQHLSYDYKFLDRFILGYSADLDLFQHKNTFSTLDDVFFNSQQRQKLDQRINFKLKGIKVFRPEFSVLYHNQWDKASFYNDDLLKRYLSVKGMELRFLGEKLWRKIRYDLAFELKQMHQKLGKTKQNDWLFPIKAQFVFEHKLERLSFSLNHDKKRQELLNGGPFFSLEGAQIQGSKEMVFPLEQNTKLNLAYNHNNLFDMLNYGVDLSYHKAKNQINRVFKNISPLGFPVFDLYISPRYVSKAVGAYVSKRFFNRYFPTNIGLQGGLSKVSNTLSDDTSIDLIGKTLGFSAESFSDLFINLEIKAQHGWKHTQRAQKSLKVYEQHYRLGINHQDEKNQAKLYFIYHRDRIRDKTYLRRNIGLSYTRHLGKLSLSLTAKNLDDLFDLFNNKNYYNKWDYKQGLYVIKNIDPALYYILLSVRYNIKF